MCIESLTAPTVTVGLSRISTSQPMEIEHSIVQPLSVNHTIATQNPAYMHDND